MAVETRRIGLGESERLIQLAAAGAAVAVPNSLSVAYTAGDLIAGKYRLVRLIGRGGMGVVWEAHSDALDIRVAIKLIHQFTASEEEQKRLLLEARAAARLVDPGVVRVFDCGETSNGEPYVVMELLEGEDLATRLDERGRIQPVEAVRTLLPIVRALGTAHAANIVHRDVKPENVFLTKSVTGEEQPKLLDFGIAKVEMPWEKRLTQAGSTLGSPNYMSPEQARGEEVDGRSDLWGVCILLYEAIAGELPFDGNSYNAVMHAILSARVTSFPELGIQEPELWAIVARGLERERALRWQTTVELADALGAWLIERGILHDVTGVSLHATKTNRRASHVRTLESVRPAQLQRDLSPSARAALANTASGFSATRLRLWSKRPRWFLPVMTALALCGAMLLIWRLQKPAGPSQPAHSSLVAEAVRPGPVSRPAEPIPVAGAAPVLGVSATSVADDPKTVLPLVPSSVVPSGNPAVQGTGARKATAAKSSAKPAESSRHAVEAPQAESFKSPFD